MIQTTQQQSIVPSRFKRASAELSFTLALLLGSASLVAMSLGDPELMALVAFAGAAVVVLTLALLSTEAHGNWGRNRSATVA